MDNHHTRDLSMKISYALLLAAGAVVAFGAGAPVQAQAQSQTRVGVSIGINQPGVYGRIDIGDVAQPALIYAQPVMIAPPPVVVNRRPIYLYVPEPHAHDWRRYCSRYNACGQPVYFVQDRWVRERYEHHHPGWERGRQRSAEGRENAQDDRGERGPKHDKKDKKDKHDKNGRGHDRQD